MEDVFWQQVRSLLPLDAVSGPATAVTSAGLGLDSLDFVELILEVEQQFNLRFSSAELTQLRAVQLLLSDVDPPLRRPVYAQFFARLLHQGLWP